MKNFLYLVIIAGLFLSAYVVFDQIRPDGNLGENIPLSKFVIGGWENKSLARSTVRGMVPEIRFIDENCIKLLKAEHLIPKTKKMFFRIFPAYAGYNGLIYHRIWGQASVRNLHKSVRPFLA